jgi:hypothetical protein
VTLLYGSPRPSARLVLRVVAALTLVLGCGGNPTIDPSRIELAGDLEAQKLLARFRLVWESGEDAERRALEPELLAYLERRGSDPTARPVSVMAAVLLVERGELERSTRLVRIAELGPPGPTRDMANVVLGAVERRRGQPVRALERLDPLYGRIIDGPTRTLLNEELLRSAVDAERFDRAALFLRAWLREAPRSARRAIAIEAEALLDAFPAEPLLAELSSERAASEPDAILSELLATHLAEVVLEREDSALARTLLDTAGNLIAERTDAVARIAARGAAVRLDRNTIGLLLPRRAEHLERRALGVASGLSFALGLPGGRARLLTRDDAGSLDGVSDALTLLQAEGAAVIVAGYERDEADRVASHAERTGLPVLLLSAPSKRPRPDGPVFVVGEDTSRVRSLLVDALVARGRESIAILADERDAASLPSSARIVAVQPCGVPLDFLRTAGARALIVDGDAACARDMRERGAVDVLAAFGLDARDAGPGLHATAGWVHASERSGASPLAAWRKTGRDEPSWWTALGHDAGALARAAVEALGVEAPADGTASQASLGASVVRDLARTEASLWTTDARGFAGGRELERRVELVERGAASRGPTKR